MAHDEIGEEKHVPRDTCAYPTKRSVEAQPETTPIDDIETVRGPLEKETTAGSLPALSESHHDESPWLTLPKWRKSVVLLCLFLGLFLSTLDTSIVATALVTILTEFNDFARSEWIVVAYLLTYMSLAVAFARLSDVYGRKTMVMTAWIIFTAFSVGCGASQSMVQLIVCRAFQGIGGSGMFSLTMVLIPEVVSPGKIGLTSGLIGATLGCSGVLGPVLGGVISNFATWRWIFFINIPLGCLTIAAILLIWPKTPGLSLSSWAAFQSIDLLGILLLVAASSLHIWGFESAGVLDYDWNSPTILAVLIVSVSCWIAFVGWELFLEKRKGGQLKPLFPFRIVKYRVMAAAIVNTFLTGFPYITTVIMLPQRFQIVNNASSLMAGVYLLPLLGASAVGSYLGGAISSKKNLTAYTLITSSVLQLLGCGLLSTLGGTIEIVNRQYLFEVILGLGIGLALSTATILTSVQAKRGELAAAQGAVSQVRVLGGIIGVTIATTIFNLRSHNSLSDYLSPSQLDALHKSPLAVMSFPPTQQGYVKSVYAEVFSQQMRVLMYVCAVAVLVSCASWERRPPDLRKGLEAHSGRRPGGSGRLEEGSEGR